MINIFLQAQFLDALGRTDVRRQVTAIRTLIAVHAADVSENNALVLLPTLAVLTANPAYVSIMTDLRSKSCLSWS